MLGKAKNQIEKRERRLYKYGMRGNTGMEIREK
jgi:hypothetical protein